MSQIYLQIMWITNFKLYPKFINVIEILKINNENTILLKINLLTKDEFEMINKMEFINFVTTKLLIKNFKIENKLLDKNNKIKKNKYKSLEFVQIYLNNLYSYKIKIWKCPKCYQKNHFRNKNCLNCCENKSVKTTFQKIQS